jgi:hypothetical protein
MFISHLLLDYYYHYYCHFGNSKITIMRYQCLHRNKKGYIYVGMPFDARCFLISLSVPYQLNPGVSCPIRGRCTLAEIRGKNS